MGAKVVTVRDDDDEKLFPVFGEMKGDRAGVELRETAFNLWMECRTQQEIADAVGFAQQSVADFLKNLQLTGNGTDAEIGNVAENPVLTSDSENREFDEDDQDDGSSLGVYKLDKRLLIKANHLDEHFTPPLYNVWKQQDKSFEG